MGIRRTLWLGIGAVGFVVACSGGGGSSGSGGSAATADAFIADFCDQYAPCCVKFGKSGDTAACRALYSGAASRATYDPAKGEVCLNGLRAASANNPKYCEEGPDGATEEACDGVFATSSPSGGKAPGEPCDSDRDCAASTEGEVDCASSFANGATERRCQVQLRAKEGDPCDGYMDGSSTSTSFGGGEFQPKIGLCYTADNLYCANNANDANDANEKKCRRMADVGGDCTSARFSCVKTATCDLQAKRCAARKAIGEACTGSSSSDVCVEGATCREGKCAALLAIGAPCTTSLECTSSSCVNGKCDAGLANIALAFICGN